MFLNESSSYFGVMDLWTIQDDFSVMFAIMTARMILGLLFMFQGYDKIFRVGISQVSNAVSTGIGNGYLPQGFINIIVFMSSWIELIAGAMMVIGIFKPIAGVALCLNLIVVVIGFSWSKPIWDENHVFVRLFLLLLIMLLPAQWDQLSLDRLFN